MLDDININSSEPLTNLKDSKIMWQWPGNKNMRNSNQVSFFNSSGIRENHNSGIMELQFVCLNTETKYRGKWFSKRVKISPRLGSNSHPSS